MIRKEIEEAIQDHGIKLDLPKIEWHYGHRELTLHGKFTVEELETILDHIKEKNLILEEA